MRLSLLLGRWALTPPFHYDLNPIESARGYLFSVALSVNSAFVRKGPRYWRGTMPDVARTFLTDGNRQHDKAACTVQK